MEEAGQYPDRYDQEEVLGTESPPPSEPQNHLQRLAEPQPPNHPYSEPRNHLPPHAEPQPPNHSYPEWLSLIMSFCFAGFSMGFQSIQASKHIPLSFHMAGLGVVFALASFVVSKYIPEYLRREARFLENTGVFFGVTAFFLEINLSFPLCLKIISWIIYAVALLAILLPRYFHFRYLTWPIVQN